MYRKTEVLAVHGAKVMENLEKTKIDNKNYFNLPNGTYANFYHLELEEAFSFIDNHNIFGVKQIGEHKSYPKKKQKHYTKLNEEFTKYKIGDVVTIETPKWEYFKKSFYNEKFLLKYKEQLKEIFNEEDLDIQIPELLYDNNYYIEQQWTVINIELVETQDYTDDPWYDDEDSYNLYIVTLENRENPHSVYYEFETGVLRISNHWNRVGNNFWSLFRGNSFEEVFQAGFCKWEGFEIMEDEDNEECNDE